LSGKTLVRMYAPTKAATDKYSIIFRKDNICGLEKEDKFSKLEISFWFFDPEVVIAF
jgi:hypothetical protein